MILRRYGTRVQSVETNFDARAMTEIGFQRSSELVMTAEEFEAGYERVGERSLTAAAEGDVKSEVEEAMLVRLKEQLDALEAEAGEGSVLLVESEAGTDYPKTRDRTKTLVVAGENRLHFEYTVDPPLRIGIYRRRDGGG